MTTNADDIIQQVKKKKRVIKCLLMKAMSAGATLRGPALPSETAQPHCKNRELLSNIVKPAAAFLSDLIDCLSGLSQHLSLQSGMLLDQRLAWSASVAQFVQSAFDVNRAGWGKIV